MRPRRRAPSGWQTPAAATVPDLRPGCISRGTCPGSPLRNTKSLSTHPRASPASMDPRPAVGALDNARAPPPDPGPGLRDARAGDRRRALWRRCRRRCAPCAAQLRALRALGALRALRTAAVVELGALCFLRAHGRPCGRRAWRRALCPAQLRALRALRTAAPCPEPAPARVRCRRRPLRCCLPGHRPGTDWNPTAKPSRQKKPAMPKRGGSKERGP